LSGGQSHIEAIPESANIDDEGRRRGGRLDFLPQVRHLVIDNTVSNERRHAPCFVDQALPAERAPAVSDERFEQPEFERRQRHDGATASELAAQEVDRALAELEEIGGVSDDRRSTAFSRARNSPGLYGFVM
jgi:hypothetical protein